LLEDNIRLTGVLDKIEFEDGGGVVVVDYKTGKSKTRNEIMGKTKNSDGNYFRQLIFYKILLDHYENGKFKMHTGVLDFIEPDINGKQHKEFFEITFEDTDALIKKIKEVAKEILDLSFWNKTCPDPECEFCALRKIMKG
jgi:DNA helicase-2/ATP-dependent DNA helicase PcrA